MTKKLILIDGHALVHRAFHALPLSMSSPNGIPTNAVYGFVSVLIKTIKDLRPDYIVATFDLAGPTFRHEEFAEYKAHREKAPDDLHVQVPLVKEILGAFGIPIYEKEGFEADDLIGSIAEITKKHKDIQTIIATGDLDTLQLVESDKVVVRTLKKGVSDTILYTQKEVEERYGLEPGQMVDFKGLKGDPSDNIPGVPGVGEKTASVLIKTFKSLEGLYQEISNYQFLISTEIPGLKHREPSPSKQIQNSKSKKNKTQIKPPLSEKLIQKLLENKDVAFFSKKLATIIRDVPIQFDIKNAEWRKGMKKEELVKMLQDLGIYSLLKRINELDGETPEQPSLMAEATDDIKVSSLGSREQVGKLIKEISSRKTFAFDIIIEPDLSGPGYIVFALNEKQTSAIPWSLLENDKEIIAEISAVFEDEKIKKTGHDLKELSKTLLKKGIHVSGLPARSAGGDFDTKIAAYLINSDIKDYDLDRVYFVEFNKNIDPNPLKRPAYAVELKKVQWEKLKSLDLLWVFEKIEVPLAPILAEMEINGVKIDRKAIKKLSQKISGEIAGLEKKIYRHAGEEFNINSSRQLSVILFEKLLIKGKVRKTGKGAISTAATELEKLSGEHPVIDLILKYRELQKLNTTYIEPFPGFVEKDGRLRTTLNQTGTTTGRLASQDPNLQNIPIRTELGQEFRKAFIAEKGYDLVSFDYSQLELRIAAHISGDKKMIEAFKKGEDIHTRTAAEIFNVPPEKVTAHMRREAKVFNFGLLYGMGITGLQRAAKISREQARDFTARYMAEFSGIARYMQAMRDAVHADRYVKTIFGRRRQFREIGSQVIELVRQAERMAINMPIQGTEADLLKLAMIKINGLIHSENKDQDVRMLLQVHDELLFEVKSELVQEWSGKIKEIMENIWKLNVPLTVDVKYGINWAQLKPLIANSE
ncbi:MAG: DNA polymerase I [Candidatus Yanofskybacteria bacterium]|nr:DNA polymerase I [Candidatus Yanofskybacteria bacterium]